MGLKQIKLSKFLSKLYNLLNDKKYNNDIDWNKNGTSFIIKNYQNFCYNIMPKIFGLNLFSSFHHQLNCYGFITINVHEYFHKFFKKDNENLLFNIKRRRKKKLNENNSINLKCNNNKSTDNNNILYILENIQYKLNNIKYRRKNVEKKLYLMQKRQEDLIIENAFLKQKLLDAQTKQKDLGYIFFSMVENLHPEFSLIKKQCLYFINSDATFSFSNSDNDKKDINKIEENNINSLNSINNINNIENENINKSNIFNSNSSINKISNYNTNENSQRSEINREMNKDKIRKEEEYQSFRGKNMKIKNKISKIKKLNLPIISSISKRQNYIQ